MSVPKKKSRGWVTGMAAIECKLQPKLFYDLNCLTPKFKLMFYDLNCFKLYFLNQTWMAIERESYPFAYVNGSLKLSPCRMASLSRNRYNWQCVLKSDKHAGIIEWKKLVYALCPFFSLLKLDWSIRCCLQLYVPFLPEKLNSNGDFILSDLVEIFCI